MECQASTKAVTSPKQATPRHQRCRGVAFDDDEPVALVSQQFLNPVGEEGAKREVEQLFLTLVLQDERVTRLHEDS